MSKKKVRPLPQSLGFPPGGADSHAHLDGPETCQATVLANAKACGVSTVANVFLSPAAYLAGRDLFAEHPEVFFLLGVHPHDVSSMTEKDVGSMGQAFHADTRLRAVGEIGLDYHYDYSPRRDQRLWFVRQLRLAREVGRPVVIHCREAEEDCLAILDEEGFAGYPLLWHCFGLGEVWAEKFLARGWHLSIPGTVTYARSEGLRAAIPGIPAERLLLETDAPYLTPEPYRGKKNEPALVTFTAQHVAMLRGEDPALLWVRCGENCRRFFGLE